MIATINQRHGGIKTVSSRLEHQALARYNLTCTDQKRWGVVHRHTMGHSRFWNLPWSSGRQPIRSRVPVTLADVKLPGIWLQSIEHIFESRCDLRACFLRRITSGYSCLSPSILKNTRITLWNAGRHGLQQAICTIHM
jgi:hypothetical protein